jgi:hypothetical protein
MSSNGFQPAGISLGAPVTASSSSDTLTVNLSNGAELDFAAGAEVGAVTAAGSGNAPAVLTLGSPGATVGSPGVGASLNGTDGNSVAFSGGAALETFGSNTVGPLTMSGGGISIGEWAAGTLAVNGPAALDSTSSLTLYMLQPGTTSGTDYSQLSANGNINLGGANLWLASSNGCPTFNVGDAYTLVKTSASLTGQFANAPEGSTIDFSCFGETPQTMRISYTTNAVTATVTNSVSSASPTTTTLSSSRQNPVTNQIMTLTATVSSSFGTPAGTVEFDNNGVAFAGCSSPQVDASGTATCETSFTASSSPDNLSVTYTPASGSNFQGSTSTPVSLTIGQDSTTTSVAASNTSPSVGQSVTYSATVTSGHSGSAEPSGSVEFLDGGTPVSGCSSRALTAGASSSTATCTVSYPAAGSHSVSASYGGDGNFSGSTSSAQTLTVNQPSPPPASLGGGGTPGASPQPGGGSTRGGGGSPGAGTKVDEVAGLKLAAGTVRSGKLVTFEVTLRAAAKMIVQILRFVPKSGHGKHRMKAHYVVVGTLSFNGKAGLNKLLVSKVHGHKLSPAKYDAEVSAGGKPHAIAFTVKG